MHPSFALSRIAATQSRPTGMRKRGNTFFQVLFPAGARVYDCVAIYIISQKPTKVNILQLVYSDFADFLTYRFKTSVTISFINLFSIK